MNRSERLWINNPGLYMSDVCVRPMNAEARMEAHILGM